MTIFWTTLNQTAFLILFIILGYILSRGKFVPDNAQAVLSKLENYLFIPALVLGTFMNNFNVEKLTTARNLLLGSFALALIFILISIPCVRMCSKDRYEQNIYLYGLCFSNFGFMGNAVVSALFPDIFVEYLIFTLPLWTLIYLWGVPVLLMGDCSETQTLAQRMKSFVNPMFICMILGMIIGLLEITVPPFIRSAVASAGNCMSPIAMLITGMTVAKSNLRDILTIPGVYKATVIRLLVFPLLFLAVLMFVSLPETFTVCAVCALAMPLGLSTIIIPGAYGKDTRVAAGMALVSHICSCLTIPVIFLILEMVL